jgi:carbohydrate-selective porin OprB
VIGTLINQMQFAQDSNPSEEKTLGFQNELMRSGIDLSATYIGDYLSNLFGGIQSDGAYLNNIIFDVGLDMEKIGRIKGMSIYISGLGIYGGFPIENSGAI